MNASASLLEPNPWADLDQLIVLASERKLTDDQAERLKELVAGDEDAGLHYVDMMYVQAGLWQRFRDRSASGGAEDCDLPQLLTHDVAIPASSPLPSPLVFSHVQPGTFGYFSSGWPVAYLLATVIFAIGLVIAALVHVSAPQVVLPSPVHGRGAGGEGRGNSLSASIVGQITGMVDCQWSEPDTEAINGAHVPLGRRYALSSGLMELTYDTGARVILQGPVTYEVESPIGGYLSIGKLTAKLEKKPNLPSPDQPSVGARRAAGGEGGRNQNSSDLCPLTSDLFAVRTPTVVVTDLGTEFGVEMDPESGTRVCVVQGLVSLRSVADGASQETVLQAGQASQVDRQGAIVRQADADSERFIKSFVRRLPRREAPALVALADLVAGGNGMGRRSDWGIDPRDASVAVEHFANRIKSSRKYERYSGLPQIDGVFIPNGANGPVQIDSAGHTFSLPRTSGTSAGPVWVTNGSAWRGAPASPKLVLRLHANVGITFDLQAIQATVNGRHVARFQTTIAYRPPMEFNPKSKADVWVLVDGRLRFSRSKLCVADGLVAVDLALERADRFLTLISSEGDDGVKQDHVQILDPQIVLETSASGATTSR
jgi:hypothetical protein